MNRALGPVLAGAIGAVAARAAYAALNRRPPAVGSNGEKAWVRTNFRDEQLTLLEGPAFALGAAGASLLAPGVAARMRLAALVAGVGSGALGAYDDLVGSGGSRGFKGHLSALARGEVTSGAVKIVGIGATGLVAAAVAGAGAQSKRGTLLDVLINGALVAGSANLLNLFDLRPGRAIKVGLLAGAPLALASGASAAVAAAPLGAALALLPEDLGERAMLGDAGANALGALLGLAAAAGLRRRTRLGLLAGVTALTAASEVVSFTKVIQATPPLNWLDQLGRRPPAPPVVHEDDEAGTTVPRRSTP